MDDELPALKMAESVLKICSDVSICGSFVDPDDLLACLPVTDVDLILLDMKMPGMSGLELAGRIQEIKSDTFIVFVTAYDEYAVDAFDIEALDYIMKPITAERMQKTLERYMKRRSGQPRNDASARIRVTSFGRFAVETEHGEPIKFRTAKTEELFAFLLHHRGNPISKDKIMDELWPDRDTARAQSMLYTTLYQLRKDLESFGLTNVIQHSRKDGGLCRISWLPDEWDYIDFTEGCNQYKVGNSSKENIKAIVELHKNGYLTDNGYSWSEFKRNELELSFGELVEEIADHEAYMQQYEVAMQYLKRWADLSPYNENVHIKIITLFLLMNRKDAAVSYYQKTNEMFKEELGVSFQIDIEGLALNLSTKFFQQNQF